MISLKNVTFLLPMCIDNHDRRVNFNLCIDYLISKFDTNILVGEQSDDPQLDFDDRFEYIWFDQNKRDYFHRTKIYNDLCKKCKTDIICLYDSDVFLPYLQYIEASNKIQRGSDMVIPYDGSAYDVPRMYIDRIRSGNMQDIDIRTCRKRRANSIGGAIFFNKKSYINAGMENETFKSWGGEDDELLHRFTKLDYNITRTDGYLLHLVHDRGEFSQKRHIHYDNNIKELKKVGSMTKIQLSNYIKTWEWRY